MSKLSISIELSCRATPAGIVIKLLSRLINLLIASQWNEHMVFMDMSRMVKAYHSYIDKNVLVIISKVNISSCGETDADISIENISEIALTFELELYPHSILSCCITFGLRKKWSVHVYEKLGRIMTTYTMQCHAAAHRLKTPVNLHTGPEGNKKIAARNRQESVAGKCYIGSTLGSAHQRQRSIKPAAAKLGWEAGRRGLHIRVMVAPEGFPTNSELAYGRMACGLGCMATNSTGKMKRFRRCGGGI